MGAKIIKKNNFIGEGLVCLLEGDLNWKKRRVILIAEKKIAKFELKTQTHDLVSCFSCQRRF